MKPKISIVTAYYNRKGALWRTLKSIEKSSFKDFEFIIVDDASDSSQRVDEFAKEFDFVRLYRVEPEDKYYINPCIPFNFGFSVAAGDMVIIQSPECLHLGDVLDFVSNNPKDNQYLVFSCYSLSNDVSNSLGSVDFNLPIVEFETSVVDTIGGFSTDNCDITGRYNSWFIHPVYRPSHFNFLVSMSTKNLLELGGFDERFAQGHAFDDTEFVSRIIKKKMDIKLIEKPFCLHQFHQPVLHQIPNFAAKEARNRRLYEECIRLPHYKVKNSFLDEDT